MSYNLPELVLVGAAKNLVLNNSDLTEKELAICDPVFPDQDAPNLYDRPAEW